MTELTNLIEIEPAANNTGNKPLSAIWVIHGVEHTCGEGKHIVPIKTPRVSENGCTVLQLGLLGGFSCWDTPACLEMRRTCWASSGGLQQVFNSCRRRAGSAGSDPDWLCWDRGCRALQAEQLLGQLYQPLLWAESRTNLLKKKKKITMTQVKEKSSQEMAQPIWLYGEMKSRLWQSTPQ